MKNEQQPTQDEIDGWTKTSVSVVVFLGVLATDAMAAQRILEHAAYITENVLFILVPAHIAFLSVLYSGYKQTSNDEEKGI